MAGAGQLSWNVAFHGDMNWTELPELATVVLEMIAPHFLKKIEQDFLTDPYAS